MQNWSTKSKTVTVMYCSKNNFPVHWIGETPYISTISQQLVTKTRIKSISYAYVNNCTEYKRNLPLWRFFIQLISYLTEIILWQISKQQLNS